MEDLHENKKLFKFLMGMFLVALCGILDLSDFVREYLQLVPFPTREFQFTIIGVLLVDFVLCYAIEKTVKRIYLNTFK